MGLLGIFGEWGLQGDSENNVVHDIIFGQVTLYGSQSWLHDVIEMWEGIIFCCICVFV